MSWSDSLNSAVALSSRMGEEVSRSIGPLLYSSGDPRAWAWRTLRTQYLLGSTKDSNNVGQLKNDAERIDQHGRSSWESWGSRFVVYKLTTFWPLWIGETGPSYLEPMVISMTFRTRSSQATIDFESRGSNHELSFFSVSRMTSSGYISTAGARSGRTRANFSLSCPHLRI